MADENEHKPHDGINLAVDVVVFAISFKELRVLLREREGLYYPGQLALPGGLVRTHESNPQAAARIMQSLCGLDLPRPASSFELYDATDRDPRRRTVSVGHIAVLDRCAGLGPGRCYLPVQTAMREHLAFDHDRMLVDALDYLAREIEATTIATQFIAEEAFTMAELREVYEAIWQMDLDPGNFRGKIEGASGFLEPTGAKVPTGMVGRPEMLFKLGRAGILSHPIRRPEARSAIRKVDKRTINRRNGA